MFGIELLDMVPFVNTCILIGAVVVFFKAHLSATRLMQDNYRDLQGRLGRLEQFARERLGLHRPDSTPGGS